METAKSPGLWKCGTHAKNNTKQTESSGLLAQTKTKNGRIAVSLLNEAKLLARIQILEADTLELSRLNAEMAGVITGIGRVLEAIVPRLLVLEAIEREKTTTFNINVEGTSSAEQIKEALEKSEENRKYWERGL